MNLSTPKTGSSSSCQCATTLEVGAKGNTAGSEYNSQTVANDARQFPRVRWSFLGPGSQAKWYGTYTHKPRRIMGSNCTENDGKFLRMRSSNISCFQCIRERRITKQRKGQEVNIHFHGCHENIELLLRTVISANQLSVYGVIADSCNLLPKDFRALGKPAAPDHLERMENPTDLSIAENFTNLVQEYEQNSNNCQKTRNYPNSVLMRV